MENNTRIKVKDTGRTGTLLELRDGDDGLGTSAKVKLDDAKRASWYWLNQLEEI